MSLPNDWMCPDWNSYSKCHDWKNYVTPDVERVWTELTPEQRKIIATCLQQHADNEEWE